MTTTTTPTLADKAVYYGEYFTQPVDNAAPTLTEDAPTELVTMVGELLTNPELEGMPVEFKYNLIYSVFSAIPANVTPPIFEHLYEAVTTWLEPQSIN